MSVVTPNAIPSMEIREMKEMKWFFRFAFRYRRPTKRDRGLYMRVITSQSAVEHLA
jgi:hypothetical protein